MERVLGKKNGADWNPAGSGRPDDMAFIIVGQIDTQRRNNFPLGFGWGDHFPWSNGYIYWRYTGGRSQFNAFSTGVPTLITMHLSKTDGVQKAFKNGSEVFNKPRTDNANYNVGSSFNFPWNGSGSYASDWTVGEMIVTKGYFTHSSREAIEGYLAGKWGLNSKLPSSHSGKDWSDTGGWAISSELSSNSLATNFPGLNDVSSFNNTTDLENSNSWHHLVVSISGDTQKFYIDGVETDSQTIAGSFSSTASALVLGAYDRNTTAASTDEIKNIAAAGHSGIKLDEVRIYDKGLTATEVSDIYNYGKGDLQKIGGFATIPTTVKANVGSVFSTTVTADFMNAVYTAYNLPNGLSINSSTGEISGTPTVGSTHLITVVASGGSNEAPKKALGTITYSAPTSAPKFGTPGAQNIVGDSALLLAEIEQSGASSNSVDMVWDTSDKGTSNLSDWNGSATAVGTGKEGFYGKQISDLTPGQTYYYRSRVELELGPLDHAGDDLKLWVDASDLTAVPNPWVDKSGSGNDLSRSGTHDLITNAQNGLNVIRTDSLNNEYYYRATSTLPAGDQTWMVLYKEAASGTTNNGAGGVMSYVWTGNSYWRFESGNSGAFNGRLRWSEAGVGWKITTGQMTTPAQFNLLAARFHDNSGDCNVTLWLNGNLHSTNSAGDAVGANGYIRLGRGTGHAAIGDYAEAVIFSSVDNTVIEKMEGYFMHKWGLAANLPSSHPYKSAAPIATAWSDLQSFTTPINTTAPTLGTQSTANLDTTSADMQVVLTDNGNAATTVKFYWGDNDGGTTASNWDSSITISNAPEGTDLRASLTGLTSGNTYYFRTWATNTANKGDDWANSTTAFTTVSSSVRETTDAIGYSNLKGWWKLDGNLNDSSGNNRHGAPSNNMLLNPVLWLDASGFTSTSAVSVWEDKSNFGNDATRAGSATVALNAQNGLPLMEFDGASYYEWEDINDIRTIFWVIKADSNNDAFLLGDDNVYHFHDNNTFWHTGHTSANIRNGTLRLNGTTINGLSTNMNSSLANLSVVSLKTTDNVEASRFSFDRTQSSRKWRGDLGELLIYDTELTDLQIKQIEGYLAYKWGLQGSFATPPPNLSFFPPTLPMEMAFLLIFLMLLLPVYPQVAPRMYLMEALAFPHPCG